MKREASDTTFLGRITFVNLPTVNRDTLVNSATPSVANRTVMIGSGHVVTVTNFLNGTDGQPLTIIGDGTTTVSNNANISTSTGANKLLAANKAYRFTYLVSTAHWYEDA